MAQTNQRSLRSWQLSLSAMHVALLLGAVLGSLACAFYLGFFSGQKVGIEMALNNNLSSAMRLPITGDDDAPLAPDEGMSDVYAKLSQLDSASEPLLPLPGDVAAAKAKPQIPPSAELKSEDSNLAQLDRAIADRQSDADALVVKPDAATQAIERALKDLPAHGSQELAPSVNAKAPESGSAATGQAQNLGSVAQGIAERGVTGKPAEGKVDLAALAVREQPPGVPAARQELAPKVDTKVVSKSESSGANVAAKSEKTQVARLESTKVELKQAKAAPEDSMLRDVLPRGWFAQVAAPDNKSEAESLGKLLKRSGFAVVIENAKVRGQEYFRVLVGPEETRQQAERLMGQLKRENGIKAEPFIRMVR